MHLGLGTMVCLSGLLAGQAFGAETTVWRLFIGDHSAPLVTAIEVDSGAQIGRFELAGPATLYATPSNRAVYAVQTSANRVAAIASGIAIDDHGDHGDIAISDPQLLSAAVEGETPIHFVAHDGHIAIFFDDEGIARVVNEDAWLDGQDTSRDIRTSAPHHGVAVQVGQHLLVSVPNEQDPTALPIGMQVVDARGDVLEPVHGCAELHGEATSGNLLAIACADGVLLTTAAASGPDIEFLPYADDLPDGRATTLIGGMGMQYFVGNFGADKVVLIEPDADEAFRLIDLPTRRVHFATDRQRPRVAYVFTEDGYLRELDVVRGELTRSLAVTEPYSMDGEWNLPRPRLAVAGGRIAITDPLKSVVHLVDAGSFTLSRDIEVEGVPFTIVAIGGSGEVHDHE